jgi:hypothetical protein
MIDDQAAWHQARATDDHDGLRSYKACFDFFPFSIV